MKQGITIQREKFRDIMEELHWMFVRHHGEVSLDAHNLEADVDYARYVGLEDLEVLHCLTARDDGKLIGYFFNMVVYHLHHKGLKTSASDMVYVAPEYRKGTGVGINLIKAGIAAMKELGVKKLYMAAEINSALARILPRLGFKQIEENFSMWID